MTTKPEAEGGTPRIPEPSAADWQRSVSALQDELGELRAALTSEKAAREAAEQKTKDARAILVSVAMERNAERDLAAQAESSLSTLQERVKVLAGALRPFAKFSSGYGRQARDDDWVLLESASKKRVITMGDVRAAEDLLALSLQAQNEEGKS